jgi:hypothetical protein
VTLSSRSYARLGARTSSSSSSEIAVAPDVTLRVLPIERVLASKLAAGRLKDKAVIPTLEAAIAAIKESR